MILTIPYTPHPKQREIHDSPVRFKIVVAGRRGGKTVLAINELLRQALACSAARGRIVPRFWYVTPTYKQAESIAWKTCLNYLPPEVIRAQNNTKLMIELENGAIIEFKGASEEPQRLKGVGVQFMVLDEYGSMRENVWLDIFRPMLVDTGGGALFIGTPEPDGSPHFHDLWNKGQLGESDYKSWLFYTSDNPTIPREEVEKARQEYPPDRFKREYEADFNIVGGLIYDNFRHATHVVPHFEPDPEYFIVGSIDPGLHNPTAALLTAWTKDGEGIIFKEYYESGKLATENAVAIAAMSKPYQVSYWVIDRASTHREPVSGLTVLGKYQEYLKPLVTAPNDAGSVWAGIDQVKTLFQIQSISGRPKLRIAHNCHKTLWELSKYTRQKYKWAMDKNALERPRKRNDHAMDCMRNMIMTRPWMRRGIKIFTTENTGY